jgi:hypothetical protein
MSKPARSQAWWSGSLVLLRALANETIVNQLCARAVAAFRTNEKELQTSWDAQLPILRAALATMPGDWRLLIEFPLVRLGRRLDTVLVTNRAVFVIEFKTLKSEFSQAARRQAEDYALDLRDFHAASANLTIIPIVVASSGTPERPQWPLPLPGVTPTFDTKPENLATLLTSLMHHLPDAGINIAAWEHAAYRPVPTIIEAATVLYQKHGVADIRATRADTSNLSLTTGTLLQAIKEAKTDKSYIILFVTGIPGAGKTLCGLDTVFSASSDATFLTGTLPMVYVLKAALALDAAQNETKSQRTAARETKSKIQSITAFLRHYRDKPDDLPEHVIVFDEAQRAWDAKYGAEKFGLADSEAAIVLDIMQRHKDYAVVVALVGNGQEINTGEAGLHAWGIALQDRPIWKIRAAPGVIETKDRRQKLFSTPPETMVVDHTLHLSTGLRNIRSDHAALWVDAVLRGDAETAQQHAAAGAPFHFTRSLADMRTYLRHTPGGNRRAGLLCSSGHRRLVAEGLWPKFDHMDEKNVANWFLKRWPADIRASNALEIPATEFAAQGLELDYVGLCWGGDLYWAGAWRVRKFQGCKWMQSHQPDARDFRINAYRVLLTRARYETVIWVPPGDAADVTREPGKFDDTAKFLVACGAMSLPIMNVEKSKEDLLF